MIDRGPYPRRALSKFPPICQPRNPFTCVHPATVTCQTPATKWMNTISFSLPHISLLAAELINLMVEIGYLFDHMVIMDLEFGNVVYTNRKF